jgi:hypothetical protein
VPIQYHIQREETAGPVEVVGVAYSVEDARDAVLRWHCPGRFVLYEHLTNGIPVDRGSMTTDSNSLIQMAPKLLFHLLMTKIRDAQIRSQEEARASFKPEDARCPKVIRMSRTALLDWRSLKRSDWEDNGWENVSESITSADTPEPVFLEAMTELLKGMGVRHIVPHPDPVPYMEVDPE